MGGTPSKVLFTSIVSRLLSSDVEPTDHDFWDDLWKTSLTAEEVFELIGPDNVRKLLKDRPQNLKIMFTQAVAQLYQVVETPYPGLLFLLYRFGFILWQCILIRP